ncbi:YpmS family protein [Agrilactobacillus yilanensis]|uniref:YpmS family protein n=1 Tax=Agrilactobacillus yilanensis TaxID=2485997 RepID=A0ABW4J7I1_9LACO|nr:YpmS family protein [Agrilactobacillus yilanensis]
MAEEKPVVQKAKRKHNPWQIAFFAVILVFAFGLIFVSVKAFSPSQAVSNSKTIARDESFSVTFNKKQVNGFTKYFIDNQLKDETIKYGLQLKSHAIVTGSVEFLNRPVQFSMICDPYVTENGNVQLKAKEIAVGQLALPLNFVLGYIGHNFNLPKWVSVNQKDKTINLRLNEYKLKNGMQFTAKKIDLKQDKIEFNVYLPTN